MKNVETKVKSIEIVIAGKSVSVSPEQAEQLYQALASLLGKPEQIVAGYPISWWNPYQWNQWTITNGTAGTDASQLIDGTIRIY
jgi:hypothetical protein